MKFNIQCIKSYKKSPQKTVLLLQFYFVIVLVKEDGMRLALLISDTEYRNAFVESIIESGSDIVLDVICKGESIEPDALIITDAKPAEFDAELLNKCHMRIVFLTRENSEIVHKQNLHQLFKYSCISRLLADISDIHNKWKGIESLSAVTSRTIACCTDSDAFSDSRCTRIGRQIIYRQGGSVLILPLGYINENTADFRRDINDFARMMYQVRKGKLSAAQSLTYTDGYGISRLLIPAGRNPIAYLDEDDLSSLILAFSKLFDTLILDIAGCYRAENLVAIKNAGQLICLETGRRRINFEELLLPEDRERIKIIKVDDAGEEDRLIDEYISEMYGGNYV